MLSLLLTMLTMQWHLDLLVSYENYGCVPENSFASHTTEYSSPNHEIKGKVQNL